jgi:hypothetical protein
VSAPGDSRPPGRDPRARPADPAGTRPKHDPAALLPAQPPPGPAPDGVVDAEVVEEEAAGPAAATAAGAGTPAAAAAGAGTPAAAAATARPPAAGPPGAAAGDLLPQRRAAGGLAAAAPPQPLHAPRFHFLYGALAACGAAAIALLALVLATGGGDGRRSDFGSSWSAWQPTRADVAGAEQIAGHVARRYRLGDGRQLVTVDATSLSYGGIPLAVAIRRPASAGGDIDVFDDDGLIYRLCGLGSGCAITAGEPSARRHLLLRREALELALFSFRYLDGIDQVAVFLPPRKGEDASQAVFFRRDDVEPQLDAPLHRSLAARTPTVRTISRSPDAASVDRLTLRHLFAFSLTQANADNSGFLVLDPLEVRAARPAGK